MGFALHTCHCPCIVASDAWLLMLLCAVWHVLGPLDPCAPKGWPLVMWACKGQEGTQEALLGSSRLRELFETSAAEVLEVTSGRSDESLPPDMVRA
jgi:hypothetical protein